MPGSNREPLHSSAQEAVDRLEVFLNRVDAQKLFDINDPAYFRSLRRDVWDALYQLLVWQRVELEQLRGLPWPYHALSLRAAFFEHLASRAQKAWLKRQALLFLALLPFPGQWRWLIKAEKELPDHPEIVGLQRLEAQRMQAKLAKKNQKTFKLRHFCQVLKTHRVPEEKGILRIFSLPYLFADRALLKCLNRHYFLYVEPPWGVLFRHTWLRAFSVLKDPCLFGLGCEEDAAFMGSQPQILTTDLAHGDFLEDDLDSEMPSSKAYDIVFNATFDDMPRKRHNTMLDLLQDPLLQQKTALFLGRGKPENVQRFTRAIERQGLSRRAKVLANIPRQDVPAQLSRCRMGVHLALHENVCRSIYEYFRSDLPCVMSSATGGMNPAIVNAQTGLIATDADLPAAIYRVLNQPHRFSPRRWFLEQSGASISSERLNRRFKQIFSDLGYTWREDIVELSSSGANRYVNQADYQKFKPEFAQLLACFRKNPGLPIRLALD